MTYIQINHRYSQKNKRNENLREINEVGTTHITEILMKIDIHKLSENDAALFNVVKNSDLILVVKQMQSSIFSRNKCYFLW